MRALVDWQVASIEPGAFVESLDLLSYEWSDVVVPGTAGSARLARDGGLPIADCDAHDWCFKTSFPAQAGEAVLRFGGIATIAEVWVNGELSLSSSNMYHSHEVRFEAKAHNEVMIVCRSLTDHLSKRRPRGKWKTRLVEMQQLRFVRTTFLGRMPSSPTQSAPVGPWRPVELLEIGDTYIGIESLTTEVTGTDGVAHFEGILRGVDFPANAQLVVGEHRAELAISKLDEGGWLLSGTVVVPEAEVWLPHTAGAPSLYPASVEVGNPGILKLHLGALGFRTIQLDETDGRFALAIDGEPIFCRGACWVPLDAVGLWSSDRELRRALAQVVDAGMNMVRVTGTTVYEQDEFYSICDELGIMVWQDFMFANVDYPIDDPDFCESVSTELNQVLVRLAAHPCVVMLCGGSEVEQQAAMMGLGPSEFPNSLARVVIPEAARRLAPGTPYVPCSPSGGSFPFEVSTGVSHYYGVGAYLRPLEDARRAEVKFTSECLAFSNIPCRETVERILTNGDSPGHSPLWKSGVPRDRAAGWDFEDVRDSYVERFFELDPMTVRYGDTERYLNLGRAAVAIAIESTLSEWRRPGSPCQGALVFTLRDLVAGAGWGLIDVFGRPKSAYYAAARASAPVVALVSDEGLNGLHLSLINDRSMPITAEVSARIFGADGAVLANATEPLKLGARDACTLSVDAMFDGFRDLSYSYRFGPLNYDLLNLQMHDESGALLSECFFLPAGHRRHVDHDVGLEAVANRSGDDVLLTVTSKQFAQFVSLDMTGWVAEDNWFHLAPGSGKTVRLHPGNDGSRFAGTVSCLNSESSAFITIADSVNRQGESSDG